MTISFTKMHGAGNDYIYIDCTNGVEYDFSSLAIQLSDRHKGIGADGLVALCKSTSADVKMRMFNADGSEGKMCGNAIRCVAKLAYELLGITKDKLSVETLSGIKLILPQVNSGKVVSATVDMGAPSYTPSSIPAKFEDDGIIERKLTIDNKEYTVVLVSMGNPHCVVFCEDIEKLPLAELGPRFENSPLFPERINTEFVKITSNTSFDMRVWERGSGETLACGTGACAALAACTATGRLSKNIDITARLLGGELILRHTDETITMTGNCVEVFKGTVVI